MNWIIIAWPMVGAACLIGAWKANTAEADLVDGVDRVEVVS
jgi:hypothetical protein